MSDHSLFNMRVEGGKEIVEITDLPKVRDAFGDDLLVAFCRCFVWTDRLMSMNFLGLQVSGLEATSVRFGRDMQTMLWFTCGSLRELARALESLLATGIEGFLAPDKLALLAEVRDILGRWNADTFFTLVRNKVCFHVDPDVLERGLQKIAASQATAIFMENEGPGMGFQRVRLAHEFLNTGLFAPSDEREAVPGDEELAKGQERIEEFVKAVQKDHSRVAELLEYILIACLEGIEAGRVRLPVTAAPAPPSSKALLEQTRQVLRTVGKHLEGWDENQPLPEKARRMAQALQASRAELKACRSALKRATAAAGTAGEVM